MLGEVFRQGRFTHRQRRFAGYLSVAVLLNHNSVSLSNINSNRFLHAPPPLGLGDSSQSQPLITGPQRPLPPKLRGAAFHLIRSLNLLLRNHAGNSSIYLASNYFRMSRSLFTIPRPRCLRLGRAGRAEDLDSEGFGNEIVGRGFLGGTCRDGDQQIHLR
jgi:hypothetical protein